jgi:hypothetical protein
MTYTSSLVPQPNAFIMRANAGWLQFFTRMQRVALKDKNSAHPHKPLLNWLAIPLVESRRRPPLSDEKLMPTLPKRFDPLAVVVDWLDACRSGDLDALSGLFDEEATLECDREYSILVGREAIVAYWGPKLERRSGSAFVLDDLAPANFGARVDYRNDKGEAARIHFHFSHSGKILHTSCRSSAR